MKRSSAYLAYPLIGIVSELFLEHAHASKQSMVLWKS
jgi:hypothetical protein